MTIICIYIEPNHCILQAIDTYYEKVRDPKLQGAAFFAVCRGKVIINITANVYWSSIGQ